MALETRQGIAGVLRVNPLAAHKSAKRAKWAAKAGVGTV
jgi:hypothetical protein